MRKRPSETWPPGCPPRGPAAVHALAGRPWLRALEHQIAICCSQPIGLLRSVNDAVNLSAYSTWPCQLAVGAVVVAVAKMNAGTAGSGLWGSRPEKR